MEVSKSPLRALCNPSVVFTGLPMFEKPHCGKFSRAGTLGKQDILLLIRAGWFLSGIVFRNANMVRLLALVAGKGMQSLHNSYVRLSCVPY